MRLFACGWKPPTAKVAGVAQDTLLAKEVDIRKKNTEELRDLLKSVSKILNRLSYTSHSPHTECLSVSFKPLLIAFHRVHLPVYLVHIMWIKFFITLVAHTNERRSRLMLKMTITGSRVEIENLFILCSARWSAFCMWRELSGVSRKITHTIRARESESCKAEET